MVSEGTFVGSDEHYVWGSVACHWWTHGCCNEVLLLGQPHSQCTAYAGTASRQPNAGIHSFYNACMQGQVLERVHAQGLPLKDKWALVTGASHGIGRAHA